jgi:DNA-binding winged helix-turn-helix (wHTH) protein
VPDEHSRLFHASRACEIDLGRRNWSPVRVGGWAFEVIEVLARPAGEIVTEDAFMDRIRSGAMVTQNR